MSTLGRDAIADAISTPFSSDNNSSTFSSSSVSEAILVPRNPSLGSVCGSSEAGSVFGNSVSWSLTGELQNLQARDEDLYGADLQRVNNNAFFGGVPGLEAKETIFLSTLVLSSEADSDSWWWLGRECCLGLRRKKGQVRQKGG